MSNGCSIRPVGRSASEPADEYPGNPSHAIPGTAMASRTSFDKLQRERRKKAKQAAKRARRQGRSTEQTERKPEPTPARDESTGAPSPGELLMKVEALQKRLQNGVITRAEFEEEKAELQARVAKIDD